MKAILVIDMPNICYKCPCYDHEGGICQASDSWETDVLHGCPLKPLPSKKEIDNPDGYYDLSQLLYEGWNYCIDTITGEKDGL